MTSEENKDFDTELGLVKSDQSLPAMPNLNQESLDLINQIIAETDEQKAILD